MKLKCPKCKAELQKVSGDAEIDACPACEGVWVELADEKKFLEIKPEVFTIDELRRLRKVYQAEGKIDPLQYHPCPVCGQMMYRKIWGSHSGIMVDRCTDHGTWFDKGETEKVREFIAAGGIEFEKMRRLDKEVSRLDSRITRETTRLDVKINTTTRRRARLWSILGF